MFGRAIRTAVIICALGPTVLTAKPFNVEEIDFTEGCQPNEMFGRIIEVMEGEPSRPAPREDEVLDYDTEAWNALRGETSHKLMLDEALPWHGLKLAGIWSYSGIERGPVNYSMIFEDDAEMVRLVFNTLGYRLPAVDDTRDIDGLEGYASIGVSRTDGGQSVVTCYRD